MSVPESFENDNTQTTGSVASRADAPSSLVQFRRNDDPETEPCDCAANCLENEKRRLALIRVGGPDLRPSDIHNNYHEKSSLTAWNTRTRRNRGSIAETIVRCTDNLRI